jgi:hypothetical protein
MKPKALVFILLAFALLMGLSAVVLVVGGDPQTLFAGNITATGTSLAATGMEQQSLNRLNAATTSIDAAIYSLDRAAIRDALGDEALCPDGAYQIFLPVVMRNSTAATEPPVIRLAVVISLDGASVHAGSDLRVALYDHQPNRDYDVYLYRASLGYWDICPTLTTNAVGAVFMATCHVPIDIVPCSYYLVSILVRRDPTPANHVGEGDVVEVLP